MFTSTQRRLIGALPVPASVRLWNLHPDVLGVEISELHASGFLDPLVSQDLPREIVTVLAWVPLFRSSHLPLDLRVVVRSLYSEAAIIEDVVLLHLVANSFEYCFAEQTRILRNCFGVASR